MWLFFAGIRYAQPFLEPLAFAAIIAMLLWPVSRTMESWGINEKLAALISVILFVALIFGIFYLLSSQIQGFSKELPQLQSTLNEKINQAQEYIQEQFGISEKQQQQAIQKGKSGASSIGQQFAMSFVSVVVKGLLMLVYIFLLLLYRQRFKNFIIKYTPEEKRENAKKIIVNSANVAKGYLGGRLLLMSILAVCYCVGLSVIGVQQAIFFGVFAAVLSIIPFVGNIIGAILPLSLALLNQGTTAAMGVVILFTATQLLENYLLEPLVVGKKVDLNGFFAISVVILGEIIWGISGAILAMPFLGIAKIIFDNIRPLNPMGYLIGEDDNENDSGWGKKLVEKVKHTFSST
jgi:predicted PurR-regulated permease PerM